MLRRILAAAMLLAGLQSAGAAGRATEMSVQVRSGPLRATPSFLGRVVANVDYGVRVLVAGTQGDWTQVSLPDGSASGWMHNSALTRKRISMSGAGSDASLAASSDEVALAGKGFNPQVEAQFKAKHGNISFDWVDRMETFRVPIEASQAFLKDGGVTPPKGGAQ